jgi:hypothetical protein
MLSAVLVALVAGVCYWATLLPGLDFGDTASFQAGVGSWTLTPRQAYPLYYALGNVCAWLDPREPAHALNLASAIYGALAAGVATWVAAELAGSVLAGLAAGLFLAFSYTFWTQAIIAEVYTLHLLIVGLSLAALLVWATRPTLARLALFYAIYALGFGNHLSMILLLPGFTLFILLNRRRGPDDPLQPRALAMALVIATCGALQYAWNFRGLWLAGSPPRSFSEALGRFWLDVTKSDWRAILVATVSETGLQHRPGLYWFDLHQQVGSPGAVLAIAGFLYIAVRWQRRGLLLLVLFLANLVFAWTYNVGDVHVFFLPSHYIAALCAGSGVAAVAWLISFSLQPSALGPDSRRNIGIAAAAVCVAYPIWRGYDTFPAVDRSWDDRPTRVMDQFTAPPHAVFGVDANWQIQNAVEYYMRRHKPGVGWFTTDELPWLNATDATERFGRFVDANAQIGRDVLVTPQAAEKLLSLGYRGSIGDGQQTLGDQIRPLQPGTLYTLGILRPDPEFPIDESMLHAAWADLVGSSMAFPTFGNYTVVIGKIGRSPVLVETSDRPFRVHTSVDSAAFDIRMESWLPTDTIRRAGFGHVIVNRRHVLTLERGVSFVAVGLGNEPTLVTYRSGIFAPIPRLRLGIGPARQ